MLKREELVMPEVSKDEYEAIINTVIENKNSCIKLSGHNNRNYVYGLHGGKTVIVRIKDTSKAKLDIKALDEIAVLRELENTELATKVNTVLYRNEKASILEYIPGDTINNLYGANGEMPGFVVRHIAHNMRILHQIGAADLREKMDNVDKFKNNGYFYNFLIWKLGEVYGVLKDQYKAVYEELNIPDDIFHACIGDIYKLSKTRKFTLCHCDLHRHNIIVDDKEGTVHFIDWELSMITDPYYDVAVHLQKIRYTQEQEDLFLKCYFKNKSDEEIKQALDEINLYRKLEAIKYAITDVVRIIEDKQDGGDSYGEFMVRYIDKLNKAYKVLGINSVMTIGKLASIIEKT